MSDTTYNREKAVSYSQEWAMKRNPQYFDFELFGGDCTNFISQCIFAGSGIMNYTKTFGWYYNSSFDRSPSWSGVQFLYNFLTTNKSAGPYAVETDISQLEVGDFVQLGDSDKRFYHSLLVTQIDGEPDKNTIYVTTHTFDAVNRQLNSYIYDNIRAIHILGVRKY